MASLDARLTALEAQTPARMSRASGMHAWCAANGIATPKPHNGETVAAWLTRVSNEALEAMMRAARLQP